MTVEILRKLCIFWAFCCMAWAPLLGIAILRGDLVFKKRSPKK